MRWLKKPMANAVYVALITAIYAAIFIVSSEFCYQRVRRTDAEPITHKV